MAATGPFYISIYSFILILFVPKRDEVTGQWRKLHNEELYDLYCSPTVVSGDEIGKNEVGWACSAFGGGERHV